MESAAIPRSRQVYPPRILNDTALAALWPTSCLLLALCGLNEARFAEEARRIAGWIVSTQDAEGAFHNFQRPDGTFLPLRSGNVNFYGSVALWIYREVYGGGSRRLFTAAA